MFSALDKLLNGAKGVAKPIIQTAATPSYVAKALVANVTNNPEALRNARAQEYDTPIGKAASAAFRGVRGAGQALNPFDEESRGNNLINSADAEYGFSPSFKTLLGKENPVYSKNPISTGGSNASQGSNVSGINTPRARRSPFDVSGITIRDFASGPRYDPENTVLHEGLHSAYQNMPDQARNDYANIVNKYLSAATPRRVYEDGSIGQAPDLSKWLAQRTGGYKGAVGGVNDIRQLGNLQTEAHSYLPEYYQKYHLPMPQDLSSYYSQYYDPSRPAQVEEAARGIQQTLPRIMGPKFAARKGR
jgi:hypothetical protein